MLKHKGEVHVFHKLQCMALYLRFRVASESAPASFSNGLLCETEQLSCWSSLFMGSVCSVCLGFSRWLVYSTLCSEFCPAVILLPDMSSLVCAVGCCLSPIQVFLNYRHLGFHLHIQQALLTCNDKSACHLCLELYVHYGIVICTDDLVMACRFRPAHSRDLLGHCYLHDELNAIIQLEAA